MYKKVKKISTKIKIIFSLLIIATIALLTISLNSNRKITFLENILKTPFSFINEIVLYPFTTLSKEKNITHDESYLIQKNKNESLEKEIEELKATLELNNTLTEYEIENATIQSRNKSYWFNTLIIDKGKKDGIKKNMAVITTNGLLGKISKVYSNSSEVKLITSDDVNYKVSVSIKINDNDNYAILNGYSQETNMIKITGVSKTTPVEKGNIVLTSGLGDLFPAGIYVGKVENVKNDKYDLSKTVYIKTKQDFNNIHYVSVLKEKK